VQVQGFGARPSKLAHWPRVDARSDEGLGLDICHARSYHLSRRAAPPEEALVRGAGVVALGASRSAIIDALHLGRP
jgi:hypothetical protein